MHRFISVALVALLVTAVGCKRRPKKVEAEATEETVQALLTLVHVADQRASLQLLKGFHDIEQNAWRWTMQKFTVTLRPPAGASQRGTTLQVKLVIPDPVIAQLKTISLSANIEGTSLPGETYAKPGEYVYSRDVPATVLASDAVTVDFTLDKALRPSAADARELGIIISSIGFEPK